MDKITLQRIELVHPLLREEVREIYAEINKRLTGKAFCRFAYTLRTLKEQADIFAQGRTKPGPILTKARPGRSYHNYGLAVDIVLILGNGASWDIKTDFDGDGMADWMEIVQVFKEYGWEWGGDWQFKDSPHFQKTLGQTIDQLHKKLLAGKVDAKGYVIL